MKTSADKVADALRVSIKETEVLRRRHQRVLDAASEPIAIVGVSCRYPGGVGSPTELWELVREGRDAIAGLPTDRGWDLERLYDPDPEVPGTMYTRHGGVLADAGDFDPAFFGISPRDALAMDPQQRLLLEASWEALEDAGVDPLALRGSQAGVFAGVMYQDYGAGLEAAPGMTTSAVSGRVAYTLGLEGPAMTVDTACSSSLVALHLAVQALRGRECSLALAGGVTVLATPSMLTVFSRQQGLSPDGRCKSFAEAADGVGFAEGVGILALERLSDAERAGHRVLATIRGSAVNQDGASNGFTAPSGPSQERVIRQALANAKLEPKEVDAVEAHGTGTTLGDPIEASALLATYGQERETPLKLGSIKSNIGHAQAAAGVAGVIKMALAMREGVLPKTLHVDAPSSKVNWETGRIELLTEPVEWETNGRPRRAAVSSFGASGTNAHLILEEAPQPAASKEQGGEADGDAAVGEPLSGPIPLILSAKSPQALRDSASRLAAHLEDNPELDLTDLSFSIATTRAAMEERAAVVGEDRDQLLTALEALATGKPSPDTHTATALSGRLAYLFTGQGSQRAAMGKELYETYPAYAKALDEAFEEIDKHLDRPLKDLLFAEPGSKEAALLDDTTYAQPALFATEVALYRMLGSFGLKPDLLTGHSVGEIVAAHVAEVLSLPDAAKLICARGALMGALPSGGAMLAIEATEQEATESIKGKEELLSIAAINGPKAAVVSGDAKAIEALDAQWQELGRKTKRLSVSHAFHSPLIEPMLEDFAKAISQIAFQEPKLPIVSNTTGELLTAEQATDPAYWVSHIREPVRFADAVATLKEQGTTTYLELGPEAVLTAMATSCLAEEDKAQLIPTLREGRDEAKSLALAFASTVAAGAKPEWSTFFEGTGAKAIPLPTYPFQRKRYWLSSTSAASDPGANGQTPAGHPLLGASIEDPQGEGLTLTGRISLQTHPWLADHTVAETILVPGTAFVEMALRAGQGVGCELLRELALQAPLALPEAGGVALQVRVEAPGDDGKREVSIHSRAEAGQEDEGPAGWTCHAQGVLSSEQPDAAEPLGAWPPEGAEPIELGSVYDRFAEIGVDYGPAFQDLSAAWRLGEEVYAEVSLAAEQAPEAGSFGIHPALFDAAFHAGLGELLSGDGKLTLPFLWRDVSLRAAGASSLRVRLGLGESTMSLDAFDSTGAPLLSVGAVLGREVDPSSLRGASASLPLYQLRWQEAADRDSADDTEAQLLELEDLGFERSPDLAATARAAVESALEHLRDGLAAGDREAERVALLTTDAVSVSEQGQPDLAGAAVWGLVRSVQAEHPGRFALIDTDGSEASRQALLRALAIGAEEPQLALREGRLLVPRLVRAEPDAERGPARPLDPESTVLVTGGLSGIGAEISRHLVEGHGARHLLLVSRGGEEAEGAADLRAQLEELGASVRIEACDVSDRERLKALLDSIDPEHPLGAIVHSAGVIDDGLLESLDAERLERVMAPKADAAWHLHELTAGLDLSAFVLFSSVAGALGGAGQGSYAAANAFLDALAQRRGADGLPAVSVGWGGWEAGMAARLSPAALARMERAGIAVLPAEQGLALFDAALAGDLTHVLPVRFSFAALRSQAATGALPPPLRGLVRAPSRPPGERGSLGELLANVAEPERPGFVLGLVRAHTATILGHGSAAEVDPDRPFKDLGFDSLAAVELRNGLGAATGLRLPAPVVFDYPTARQLAGYLLEEASGAATPTRAVVRARSSEEPIAIVGMSCRYPGANSPEKLWELVREGRDAIVDFPADRGWQLERLYSPDPDEVGTSYCRHGGFLPDAADFDPSFFAISPREALGTDPQQRLLLESSWEALEDAGIDPTGLQGSDTGVFAGVMMQDYGDIEHGLAPGMAASVISGRIAYSLGLEGPAMTVDTACSSSLVTLHLASQALRQGECDLALAGGVTVHYTPWGFTFFAQQRGLAPDGRSKSFAEAADGVGLSEGVGVLALERLSEAEANGHRVLATIRGSAVNQDGASNGITAPNGPSQERVIRQALANARLEPKDVDAVEAHGTGTTLGDPIEAGALLATYGQDREAPLKLGSIKSNIGHAQAAAGVAGVIKTVMAMREGVLPKTLHVDAPSSKVDWEAGSIELLTEPIEWKPNGHPRRAGVSSFGASGTNAHLILEEAPRPARQEQGGEGEADGDPAAGELLPGPIPLILSAKSPQALRDSASRLAAHLEDNPELDLTDLSFSLVTTRAAMEERAAVVGEDRDQLLTALEALATGKPSPDTHTATALSGRLAYLFTGQGSQRAGMGKGLYETYPTYREALNETCEEIDKHLGCSLKELLFSEPGSKEAKLLDDTTYAQPALFATEVALYRLLGSFGLKPDLLTGHSVGEIVAAHIAGALDLKDAAKLICARGRLMGALPSGGAMLAIEATEQEAKESIAGKEELLSIAAINGPTATVVSGDAKAIEALDAQWQAKERKTKRLSVSHAFHSPLIEPMLEDFAKAIAQIAFQEPKLPIVSNTTGELLTTEQATDPTYWVSHVREPVRFADAVATLKEQGTTTYLELGPEAVLTAMATSCLAEDDKAQLIPTLREGRDEARSLSLAFASTVAAGAKPDWSTLFKGTGAKAIPLPTYPFQRKRYWLNPSGGASDPSAIGQISAGHPLLAARVEDPRGGGLTFTGRVSLESHPWLAGHVVAEAPVLPGAAFLEMALAAGREVGCGLLAELSLQAPLVLPETGGVALQVRVEDSGEDGEREISIHARAEASEEEPGEWTCHAQGVLSAGASTAAERLEAWPPEGAEPIELDALYDRLAEVGFEYGPAFQGLSAAWQLGDEVYAEVALAEEQASEAPGFGIHPALLDAAFHARLDQLLSGDGKLMLPFLWRDVRLDTPGASSLRVRLGAADSLPILAAFDSSGAPLLSVGSLAGREVEPGLLRQAKVGKGGLFEVEWRQVSAAPPADDARVKLVAVEELEFERFADRAAQAHAAARCALSLVQEWLAEEQEGEERLVLLTANAVAASSTEDPDVSLAPLWGLLRSANSEHPGRFALIDSDGSEASQRALPAALAIGAEEPQLALREGRLLAPRLVAAQPDAERGPVGPLDPESTVLITGGLSGIGAAVARHLIEAHGARNLLLVSRRGIEAEGALDLVARLEELGAEVAVAACDVSDRAQLQALLEGVDPAHPLGAVVHSAGLAEDGVIESLEPEQLDRVLAAKVDAAWHLHTLTEGLDLSHFLLFSSTAGLLGGAAQSNYAAANAFLDALAQHRQARDLPAASLAWGLWGSIAGAGADDHAAAEVERRIAQIRARLGFAPISVEQGLSLFDAACSHGAPLVAPVHFDRAALRAQASQGTLPAPLRDLAPATSRRQRADGALADRLAAMPEAEREAHVLELVRGHAAAVLGFGAASQVEPERPFRELGFDSLAAVELRNRLDALSGVRLPTTIVFDYPTAKQLASYLLKETSGSGASRAVVARAQASEEPIAIVGMSCRLPGGVGSPAELWDLVSEGHDAITGYPADRGWDLERLYDPDPDSVGTSYCRHGGFMSDAADFDPGFFAISPREALATDPQQRLLLESSWEALEDAGIDPDTLRGSTTGVYAGVMYQDYGAVEHGLAPGMSSSGVSGRIAYSLGLEGPAMSVDTACSSSLVSLHLAAQALRQGECSLALAGGVTVLSTPGMLTAFSQQRGLSPDGRCKSFAETADGVGFAEGVGMLALERLSEAEARGRRVFATIRGSAVNQDGASNGFTAPNGPSQERVIRQALANARLRPEDIDAVEAHGTGTTLGDPIEAGALLATYGQDREQPLRLGSIKSNIGHTQAAAGVSGVIKTVMAMREGVLPKTLHVDAPSSKVDWEAGEIELLTEAVQWKPNGRPRRAGVSSFGASGTNAHLILEEAPEPASQEQEQGGEPKPTPLGKSLPFVLSAKAELALRESASRLAARIEAEPELSLTDLAHSLTTTRSTFEDRAVVVAEDREQLLSGLSHLAAGSSASNLLRASAKADQRPVFLFPGQGSQWLGMGVELSQSSAPFAKALDACEEALEPFVDWSLREVLGEDQGAWLDRLDIVQPALFALMVSLARLWQACGIEPSVVAGHSQGEIAAAHVAGALSLQDASRVIALRAKAMTKIAGKGAMASVSVPEAELERLLSPYGERISLAALNGPASLVLSGETEAIEALIGQCDKEEIRAQRIAVDYAAHSAQIEALEPELLEAFAPISPQSSEIPLHSTLTGERIDTKELDAKYWYRNLREPVRLEPVIRSLLEQGQRTLIEIGPHPVLGFAVQETIDDALGAEGKAAVLGSLRRDEGAQRFALSLAQAHVAGAKPEWSTFFEGTGAKAIPLPTYPFQRKRYWLDPASANSDPSAIGQTSAEHPLLAATIEDPEGEGLILTGRISLHSHPWLGDHAVAETVLLPGTAFVEMALKAGAEAGCELLSELTLQAPLIVPEAGAIALQVRVASPNEEAERAISIHSRAESAEEEPTEWVCHAQGILSAEAPAPADSLAAWPPEGAEPIELDSIYDRLADLGFEYGPTFQGLSAAWKLGEDVYAEVSLGEDRSGEAARFGMHPALLDAAAHAGLDLALAGGGKPVLPFLWHDVRLDAAGASSLRVRLGRGGEEDSTMSLETFDPSGAPLLTVGAVLAREVDPSSLRGASASLPLYQLRWQEVAERDLAEEGTEVELLELDELDFERSADAAATANAATRTALAYVQGRLGEVAPMVLLTRNAVATTEEEEPDLAGAAVWGLMRGAQVEYPGGFVLLDTDGSEASRQALAKAIAIGAEEPQLALREGKLLVPRIARLAVPDPEEEPAIAIDPDRTVLVSGGTGGLGALVARRLTEAHGARHLLLLSRSGEEAEGAADLRAQLEEFGASVRIEACDVSDRERLKATIDSIDLEHPLGAVVHSAGVLDDGVLESLDAERLERVMAPKADAAWHLHELTADLGLSAFVLFSSIGGTVGGAGQANYGAANAFLDALAQRRRASGLEAISIGWGLWEGGMAAGLSPGDLARMERTGVAVLDEGQGLALFDATLAGGRVLALPVRFNFAALRSHAAAGALPPALRGLVRAPVRTRAERGSLGERLAGIPEADRLDFVLDLVRTQAAGVLGHASATEVDPERPFKDLGFDSLGAVELRNGLTGATGVRLPATVVFDYPTVRQLAKYLLGEASGGIAKLTAVKAQASEEPIAIVGMSCRFPGGAGSPRQLWSLLSEGGDAIGGLPADRGWDLERLYDPNPGKVGTSYAREGGFVSDAADFDPAFFAMSPRDARGIDPQQRLLLESSWEALEDAGIDPTGLQGSGTGVFAGVMSQDYGAVEQGSAPGMTTSGVTGRVSYALGLEGPAMTVDTACSSSLVAMHLACQALRAGECSLALAGGVTVLSTPWVFTFFAQQRGLAPDGRSKSFAEAADGVGLSEGVGVLALERLSEAERAGHRVLATIRGSAVNQDGASNGITAPNGPSQERVIRQALANARLEPKDVDAVEAHGTGTTLGDPIEAGALLATYGQDREAPLRLGSIKSNIGHAQAAAGVAGVIKTVMAMREGVLPKTLHVDAPSSKVDWEAGSIELLTEPIEWKPNGHPRRAGVSSFGASGTNAHLILEEAPRPARQEQGGEGEADGDPAAGELLPGPIPLILSAKSPQALRDSASRLAAHLEDNPELDLTDLSFSLVTTRAAMEERAAVVGEDRDQLLTALEALATGKPSPDTHTATALSGRLAYLFTGQGSQRAGMGKELHETYPAYAKALDEACAEIDSHLDRPLKDFLFAEPGSKEAALLDDTTYAQPALFATEVALFRLLGSFGLKPDLLTGHSVGEIVAAHIAGALDLKDAAKLICARGRLMGALPSGGAMLAIEATEQEAKESIAGKEELLSIAAINGPTATVVSGDAKAIEALDAQWQAKERKTKRLSVSHAFHSPLIEPMLEDFAKAIAQIAFQEPKLPIVSNTTGELLTTEQATDPTYWVSHVREPVRFADAVATLKEQGTTTYLELGPEAVLTAMATSCLAEEDKAQLIPTLREGRDEAKSLALAFASSVAAGAKPEWSTFFKGTAAKAIPLPTYPFQRKRYWLNPSGGASDPSAVGQASAEHPVLGASIEDPRGEGLILTGRVSQQTHTWLADHAVAETVLVPGTAFVEMALRAGQEVGCELLRELTLQAPLLLPGSGGVALQVRVEAPGEDGDREISIHSRPEAGQEDEEPSEWTCHAQGVLSAEANDAVEPLGTWPPEGAEPIELDALYDRLAEVGFEYGPAFQGLTAAWKLGDEVYAEVSLAEEQVSEADGFGVHPVLLDAAFHAGLGQVFADGGKLMLPFLWRDVRLDAAAPSSLRVKIGAGGDESSMSLGAFDPAGAPILTAGSVTGREVDPASLRGASVSLPLYQLRWQEAEAERHGGEEAPAHVLELEELGFERSPDVAATAGAAVRCALEYLRGRLAAEDPEAERLVLLTRNAMATSEREGADPVGAAVWGLMRSAQAEYPGRFALVDDDGSEASREALAEAVAIGAEEPQLALREGKLLVPRVARLPLPDRGEGPAIAIDPDRTVLVTGGTGGLGALAARHLAEAHGARRLLLLSRGGEEAEGAADLRARLEELGASVRIEACDVSDRERLKASIDSIDPEHPLGAVVHSAGVIDDGVLESLDAERLERVMAPKADAAWHLHELTADLDLSAFVLFSSVGGTVGGPAQGNYAAANAFLDALAQHRAANGEPAISIGWGRWEAGMASRLSPADLARMERTGVAALSDEQGLALFDAALASDRAHLLPVRFNLAVLRSHAAAEALPAPLRGLASGTGRREAPQASLAERLAALPEAEHAAMVLDLVRTHTATVLGHGSPGEVDPERAFMELGFDSLAAVELRNHLSAATGLRLPATAVFDYPSASALAAYLLETVAADGSGGAAVLESGEREIREALASIPLARLRTAGLFDPLLRLAQSDAPAPEPDSDEGDGAIDAMDVEELIRESVEDDGLVEVATDAGERQGE